MERRRYLLSIIASARVPYAYQEVEYIESTGTQYIDTGLVGKNTSGINLTVSTSYTNDQVLVGIQSIFQLGSNVGVGSTQIGVYYGWGGINTSGENRPRINANEINNFKLNYKNTRKSYFNDVENPNLVLNYQTISTSSNTLTLFCRKQTDNSLNYFASIKLIKCEITDGTTLVRNFIPVYRKSDSVIGLYDTVSGQFFTNQGTGIFLKGGNVNRR